jgi:uncharacterized membrane protein YozB (DUF420 family)
MDIYLLVATLSLAVQIIVLALLITAYWSMKKQKFRRHGIIMFSAVIVHLTLILGIMVPSFSIIAFTNTGLSSLKILLVTVHATFGAFAASLGVYIVASWRLRTSLKYCVPKKRIMLATFTTWLISISLGIIVYLTFYMR